MSLPCPRRDILLLLGLIGIVAGIVSCSKRTTPAGSQEDFVRLSREGKKHYDAGDLTKATQALELAAAMQSTNRDAHLNVANAHLLANHPEKAIAAARRALALDDQSAAGHFIAGCGLLRLGQFKEAIASLSRAKAIDRTINAVAYQLGIAYQQTGDFEAAAREFAEVAEFEPDHAAAHYNLSQVYARLGKTAEAAAAIQEHQRVLAGKTPQLTDAARFERSRYTRIIVPFKLEPPLVPGIAVTFTDGTAVLGDAAANGQGPVAVVDLRHNGFTSLVVQQRNGDVALLFNSNGTFSAGGVVSAVAGRTFRQALVGDLNNDRVEDVLMLGDNGVLVLKLNTNGLMTDITAASQLREASARAGLLLDVDYSGTLDLLAVGVTPTNPVVTLRNLGQPYFIENTTNIEAGANLAGAYDLLAEDWTGDELLDIVVARTNQPPLLLARQRQGRFAATNVLDGLPSASAVVVGDVNNDFLPDMILATANGLVARLSGTATAQTIPWTNATVNRLYLFDYDNDGWLDLAAIGKGLKLWRNVGSGFSDMTTALGLDSLADTIVDYFAAADFDNDCDTDIVIATAGGLRLLSNTGGNANHQIKLRLAGTKSNASGLGIKVEVMSENLQLIRRITSLPVEIGFGKNDMVDSLIVHWFDFDVSMVDSRADQCAVMTVQELQINAGSCPFLYAWDGSGFRFVTDLLGASPAGLPLSEQRLIDPDPEEFVRIGDEGMFPSRGGDHVLQITEELREVLYLDEAKLVVVDHPPGTEVHTTGKLLPGPPFSPHRLVTLHRPRPLVRATDDHGRDITPVLEKVDGHSASPAQLRISQLMGLAEPFAVTLDFGELPVEQPWVLAITAWLRFGGATANVAASHDPALPFPFPTLDVEVANGVWRPVDIVVGAPAGKTKNFIVDLSGKLPPGARRLRLKTAFEIHWDRIALLEKSDGTDTHIHTLTATTTDLHRRGFSHYESWGPHLPLTPRYASVDPDPVWRWTPAGWCTRYGPVDELITARDNALALLNGGDELTLTFSTQTIPAKPDGMVRDFFLYTVGWDKDADIHCAAGWQVEPLPWHGMDAQAYGSQPRPSFPNDDWIERYNTRWVGGQVTTRAASRRPRR